MHVQGHPAPYNESPNESSLESSKKNLDLQPSRSAATTYTEGVLQHTRMQVRHQKRFSKETIYNPASGERCDNWVKLSELDCAYSKSKKEEGLLLFHLLQFPRGHPWQLVLKRTMAFNKLSEHSTTSSKETLGKKPLLAYRNLNVWNSICRKKTDRVW